MKPDRSHEFVDPLLGTMKSLGRRIFPAKGALGRTSKRFYEEFLIKESEDAQNIKVYRKFVLSGYLGEYDEQIDYVRNEVSFPKLGTHSLYYVCNLFIRKMLLQRVNFNHIDFILRHIVGKCLKENNNFEDELLVNKLSKFLVYFVTFINTLAKSNRKKYIHMLQTMLTCGMYSGIFNIHSNMQVLGTAVKFLDYEVLDILLSFVVDRETALSFSIKDENSPIEQAQQIQNKEERERMLQYLAVNI